MRFLRNRLVCRTRLLIILLMVHVLHSQAIGLRLNLQWGHLSIGHLLRRLIFRKGLTLIQFWKFPRLFRLMDPFLRRFLLIGSHNLGLMVEDIMRKLIY